jgi:hypothetical protein
MSAPGEAKPARPDRVAGRALSPRSFRPFGVEAVVLGARSGQEGLVRREGVALWRRLPEYAPVFDRAAAGAAAGPDAGGVLAVRVVVATTPARDRALRVPALGERAARALAVAEGPPPASGWLLLVDEGPGEVWLYLAEEDHPVDVLDGFIGRRGRTDFGRARQRSQVGNLASVFLLVGLGLVVYGAALGLGTVGQVLGGLVVVGALVTLVRARPR